MLLRIAVVVLAGTAAAHLPGMLRTLARVLWVTAALLDAAYAGGLALWKRLDTAARRARRVDLGAEIEAEPGAEKVRVMTARAGRP